MNQEEHIWREYEISDGSIQAIRIGSLNLWIQRLGGDWLIAKDYSANALAKTESLPEAMEWCRWPDRAGFAKISLRPCVPDRPLLVKSKMLFQLPEGTETTFYVSMPVWVSAMIVSGDASYELCKIPTIQLSNSWFGSFFEGELCYALKSSARRGIRNAGVDASYAICPVTVNNRGDSILPISKICIRPQYLSIYTGKLRMWTNAIHVTFRGEGLESRLDYSDKAPSVLDNPVLLQAAKEIPGENFFKKTFVNHILNSF